MQNIVVIYFSGTGNTEYVARKFSYINNIKCYSIEEEVDFDNLIKSSDIICLCYPIHHSLPPIIMKEFINQHYDLFKNKKIMSLATQQMFSGDGAYSINRYLPECRIIYTEHFNMPNNIGNIPFWSKLTKSEFESCINRVNKKIIKITNDINAEKIKLKGSSSIAKAIGSTQSNSENRMEKKRDSIKISNKCILCKKCVVQCPKKNLFYESNQIKYKNLCTFCYRCVNICPTKAITVLIHKPIEFQYDVRDKVRKLCK